MNRKHSPIQKKLMAVIMMTSGIVLVLTCAAFFVYELITARELARRHLSGLGKIVASNSTAALAFNSKEDATETLNALRADPHIVAACLFDTTGKLFASYPASIDVKTLPEPPFRSGYSFGNSFLSGFETVSVDGVFLGTLFMKSDMEEVNERFKLYAIIAIVFILISFVFAYFISRRLQKSISDPILKLADTAKIVSDERNYSVRAVKSSDDEVGDLTDAFNHMLTRIEIQNAEITALNLNLEQKVKERTLELENAIHALRQQTEFSDKILDATVDLIAVLDTEFRYVTLNKHSEDMYGMTRDEVKGKQIHDLFPAVVESGMLDDLKMARSGEFVRRMYLSPITKRQYESFYIPLKDHQNEVYRILVVSHDITDIMQANSKLQKLNTELEKSNLELEQFAYVASHDLQEPLRKIQTFTELSEKNLHDSETLKKYLGKVSSSAFRMAELIKAVLNYSRLAKSDTEFVQVDLNTIMQNIFLDLELLIEEKKAEITYDDLPVIYGVPLQLHQLFLNLITNSLKFSEQEPKINISCRTGPGSDFDPSLQLNRKKNYVFLEFTDNGIGFEQKFSDKIFSIFQRLHNDRTFAGTGIGLALCKKIVENHDGVITVRSEPNKGTTFYIYLPERKVNKGQFTKISSTKK